MNNLYGEAGRVHAAGLCAVSSGHEGSCTGALRRQHHVVVYPLTPFYQQVGQSGVQRDVAIVSEQHLLRHQPHLDDKRGEAMTAAGAENREVLLQDLLEVGWRCGRCVLGPSLSEPPTHPHTLEEASESTGCWRLPILDALWTAKNTVTTKPQNIRQHCSGSILRRPLWPVVTLSCDGSVALRQTVPLTAGILQHSRAACHLQQILSIVFTQELLDGNRWNSGLLAEHTYNKIYIKFKDFSLLEY